MRAPPRGCPDVSNARGTVWTSGSARRSRARYRSFRRRPLHGFGPLRLALAAGGRRVRIAVENLACRRSGRLVFEGLSFALDEGQALVFAGRNGAGKSSLLAILAGQL